MRAVPTHRSETCTPVSAGFIEDAKTGTLVNFYELLGVKPDATKQEIKSAYYELAKVCHPDIAGTEGGNLCMLLNYAYAALKCAGPPMHVGGPCDGRLRVRTLCAEGWALTCLVVARGYDAAGTTTCAPCTTMSWICL